MMLIQPGNAVEAEREGEMEENMDFMVAREGSELATTLREKGWLARAGWRSTGDNGESVWYVRFQRPDDTDPR